MLKVREKSVRIPGGKVFQVDRIVSAVMLVLGTTKRPAGMYGNRDEEIRLEEK